MKAFTPFLHVLVNCQDLPWSRREVSQTVKSSVVTSSLDSRFGERVRRGSGLEIPVELQMPDHGQQSTP